MKRPLALVLAAVSLVAWVMPASCAADRWTPYPHQWARIDLSGEKPGPRKFHGLTSHEETLYVYGGYAPGGHYLGTRVEECPATFMPPPFKSHDIDFADRRPVRDQSKHGRFDQARSEYKSNHANAP